MDIAKKLSVCEERLILRTSWAGWVLLDDF